ncbi:S-adenosyl-L-methionine-dependent methyltransferase [Lasiosphaeria miniovina]|uniref:tRNA (guanine(26)-N(2))-dimethyltransferase n=1 Tax=Lasiosphaeria miniovina TaxID=1954250 RepID=A0AA40DG31_9PEZI|nr:S-adenosyl-L-methionine-dependent methyltransferase [Lasiosphaeria miniovina]KAK0701750.1 S-adenosyl-L-methionine-dependent methyltransferase [Lasiosphaeria miniovina]
MRALTFFTTSARSVRRSISLTRTRIPTTLPSLGFVSTYTATMSTQTAGADSTAVASIASRPAHQQLVVHEGIRYTTIKEGLAYILVPENSRADKKKAADKKPPADGQAAQQVFYNPIQQFNRDLTVLTIKAFGRERVELKEAANRARFEKFSDKKRKRKAGKNEEQSEEGDRPAKSPKRSADATAGSAGVEQGEGIPRAEPDRPDIAAPVPEASAAGGAREAAVTGDSAMEDIGTAEAAATNGSGEAPLAPSAPCDVTEAKKEEKKAVPFTILDALSASGLRALRYAHEIPFVTSVTSNDLLQSAVKSIKLNVQHNKLEDKIVVSHDDALAHMYTLIAKECRRDKSARSEKYDVVDLDPYGSAAPFLDAAVQAVRDDGGLLCVTCTDSGVWASNGYPEKCFALYGGTSSNSFYSHELGLRVVLHAIEASAAKYGLAIEPLLSLSIDFYLRLFVRIKKSPAAVKFQAAKNMLVHLCDHGCGAFTTQPLLVNKEAPNKNGSGTFYKHTYAKTTGSQSCDHCGSTTHVAGPVYGGYIQSPPFIKRVLAELRASSTDVYGTTERMRGMLQTALEEVLPAISETQEADGESKPAPSQEAEMAAIDPYPFYFHPSRVAGILHCASPPERKLKGALRSLGYRVTRSHCKPGSIKTDAPWSAIWHVMREWVRQEAPVTEANIKPGCAGYRLLGLDKPGRTEAGDQGPKVVFDESLGRDTATTKLVRYQQNPREHWGPLGKAKGK